PFIDAACRAEYFLRPYMCQSNYWTCLLPVCCPSAMLSKIMAVQQRLRHRCSIWINLQRDPRHLCNSFQNHCVMDCTLRSLSPGEGCVPCNQNSGSRHWIKIVKAAGDCQSSVVHVVSADFKWCQLLGYWNGSVE